MSMSQNRALPTDYDPQLLFVFLLKVINFKTLGTNSFYDKFIRLNDIQFVAAIWKNIFVLLFFSFAHFATNVWHEY